MPLGQTPITHHIDAFVCEMRELVGPPIDEAVQILERYGPGKRVRVSSDGRTEMIPASAIIARIEWLRSSVETDMAELLDLSGDTLGKSMYPIRLRCEKLAQGLALIIQAGSTSRSASGESFHPDVDTEINRMRDEVGKACSLALKAISESADGTVWEIVINDPALGKCAVSWKRRAVMKLIGRYPSTLERLLFDIFDGRGSADPGTRVADLSRGWVADTLGLLTAIGAARFVEASGIPADAQTDPHALVPAP